MKSVFNLRSEGCIKEVQIQDIENEITYLNINLNKVENLNQKSQIKMRLDHLLLLKSRFKETGTFCVAETIPI